MTVGGRAAPGRIGPVDRARVAATRLAGVVLLAACASQGIPPGGPPDAEPPVLLRLTPDSQSVNVRADRLVLAFDEVVNERSSPAAAGGGAGAGLGMAAGPSMGGTGSTLAGMFVISPSDGRERVLWRRDRIEVEPRGGFRPNTTYAVALLPGLSDLRGNARKEGVTLTFSTGPALAAGRVDGVLFDWVAGRAAVGARVEAFLPADTAFRWRTRSDSAGRFALAAMGPGTYLVRGWVDQNQNGQIDGREAFDTLRLAVDTVATAELYAFEHDTIGPRLEAVDLVDSTGLRLKFDRAPATDWRPDPATVQLFRTDSSRVPLGLMLPAAEFDSLRAIRRAAADSAAADSARAVADTAVTPATDTAAAPAVAPPRPTARPRVATDSVAPRLGVPRLEERAPAEDSVPRQPPPSLDRPIPVLSWVVPLDTALAPGTYRLKVRQVRGLTGRLRDSEREIRIRPPAPRDTTAARSRRP